MADIGPIRLANSQSATARLLTADGTTTRITIRAVPDIPLPLMQRILAAFIHALHPGKVVVIGHSYGALTALFLAAKHPNPSGELLLHLFAPSAASS